MSQITIFVLYLMFREFSRVFRLLHFVVNTFTAAAFCRFASNFASKPSISTQIFSTLRSLSDFKIQMFFKGNFISFLTSCLSISHLLTFSRYKQLKVKWYKQPQVREYWQSAVNVLTKKCEKFKNVTNHHFCAILDVLGVFESFQITTFRG